MDMSYKVFKERLSRWENLTEDQLQRIYACANLGETVYVSGQPGPIGKTSLVARLKSMGVKAEEIYYNNLIILGGRK